MEASTDRTALYAAAVGSGKAEYYVPKFLAFDQPGSSSVSWNWPAFFVTWPWLLYRRMYALCALYMFPLPLLIGLIGGVLIAVLGETVGTVLYLGIIVLVQFVAVPMFANKLYHRQVSKRIDMLAADAPSSEALLQRVIGHAAGSNGGAVVIAAVAVIPVIGILAAIAIPAYQDYTIRAQVTEGLTLAGPVKELVSRTRADTNTWLDQLDEDSGAGLALQGQYVAAIEVIEDGVVLITYGNTANTLLANQVLDLRPTVDERGVLTWNCGYAGDDAEYSQTTIKPKYLPRLCRARE